MGNLPCLWRFSRRELYPNGFCDEDVERISARRWSASWKTEQRSEEEDYRIRVEGADDERTTERQADAGRVGG